MRTAALIAVLLVLCACGKQGALERPDPIFGDTPRPEPQQKQTP